MAIVTTDNKHYKAIADAIRNNGGSYTADSYTPEMMPTAINELADKKSSEGYENGYSTGEQRGYDDGKQAEYDAFWDTYQDYGNPRKYTSAFRGYCWNDDIYNPKYPIVCTPTAGAADAMDAMFAYTSLTDTKVPITYLPTGSVTVASLFYLAKNLVTIRKLVINERVGFSGWFGNCSALENLTIEGTIGKNGFNVAGSPKLTHDSLMSIINALKDYSGSTSTYTLTLGPTNLAKLTDGEKAIATQKGWTLA